MAKKPQKVVRYPRSSQRGLRAFIRNINIGKLIFLVIFIYMLFSVYTYWSREKIQPYEVTEGAIVNDRNYTGIILRKETTQYLDTSGYVNYYVREGRRVAVGTSICSVDETGSLAQKLEEMGQGQSVLSDSDLSEIKKSLTSYSLAYNDNRFGNVYDVEYSLESLIMEYSNFGAMSQGEDLAEKLGGNFKQLKAPVSGIVSYAVDSYENLDETSINADVFDRTGYSRLTIKTGQPAETGTPAYKVITDDTWSVVFPLGEEDLAQFGDKTSLKINFPSENLTMNGAFSVLTGTDGKTYGKLDFKRFMIQFEADRYVDFEVVTEEVKGLKIPLSSVASKDFYRVPAEYLTTGGDGNDSGFNKEVYSDQGTSIVFVPATIYYSDEESCYIDMGEEEGIHAGDYLIKPGSQDRYQVGQTGSLQGVYNINKGYSVFRQIEILAENNEFYIVQKGTRYGLNVYDHIILDADAVEGEGVLVYQ